MTEPTTTSDSAQTLLEAGSDLLHAAQTKSAKEVEVLLKDKEAPVWYQDESGWSSLHYAAEREDLAMIKVLLKHGAVWNAGELCLPSFLPSSPSSLTISLTSASSLLAFPFFFDQSTTKASAHPTSPSPSTRPNAIPPSPRTLPAPSSSSACSPTRRRPIRWTRRGRRPMLPMGI
jgi:hypothetical protein